MKNILIINLRRIGDVYSTGHLLNSLSTNKENSVSLLVYKESEKAATNLKNVSNLHVIDRKEIITLKTNKLFSDGFSIERLFNQLQSIKNQKWDEIINYSNDLVGAYICSYLKESSDKIIGVHFNENRNVVTNSDWEILFNDVLPAVKYAPMHFVDCYHKMIGVKSNLIGEKIITDPAHNATVFSNMSTIRKGLSTAESASKIIGLQLKTADANKDIPEETLTHLIQLIRQNDEFIPVLLIAPTEEERKYAATINQKFNDELVVIEADLRAVASVLMNLDILVTPDTAIKHIADLTETPVLEISLGYAPFLKQGSYAAGSLILTDFINDRNFKRDKFQSSEGAKTNIKAQDIMSSLMYHFTKTKSIRPRLSNDVTLYTCSFDHLGARYSVVAGTVDAQTEIHRLMSRQLINVVYDECESVDIYNDVIDFGIAAATNWSTTEKTNITNVMKDLLGTLRSLLQSQENRKSAKDFVNNLGKLIAHAEVSSLIQIPVTMFKTKIESINAKTFEENSKEVEILLYDLKADIQKILLCIKKLEDNILIQKKEEFMNRTSEISSN